MSNCCKLITNGNNIHKNNIKQIKDHLPKHLVLSFIRHKQTLRKNKDYKTLRDVLLQVNITDRPWEAKQLELEELDIRSLGF